MIIALASPVSLKLEQNMSIYLTVATERLALYTSLFFGGSMSHGFLKGIAFAAKGAALGFALGVSGAVFGTIIGSSFASIWASGMPLGMAFLGAMIFGILSSIGMHNGFSDNYHEKPSN